MKLLDFGFLFITGLGVINGLVLSFYILSSKKLLSKHKLFIALFIILYSVRIAKHILVYFDQQVHAFYHHIWYACFAFSAPVLFYAVKFSIPKKFNWSDLLFFLPAAALFFYNAISGEEMMVYLGILITILFFTLLSIKTIYQSLLSNLHTNVNNRFNRVLLIFVAGSLIIHLQSLLGGISFFELEAIYFSVSIYFIFGAFIRLQKLSGSKRTMIDKDELETFKEKISQYFVTERLYLNPDLKLTDVSEKMNITHHVLSRNINEAFKLNFNDFVNSYRVEHAKNLLKDPGFSNYKISVIANESGFHSLSAFNSAFKKFTNTTPSQFRLTD